MEYTVNCCTKEYNYIKPVGDKVLLKKLVNKLNKTYGDIVLPENAFKNGSFGIAEVIDFGKDESIEDSCIQKGDYVLYDYYSVYHDNPEYVLTKIENIILRLTKEEAESLIKKSITFK